MSFSSGDAIDNYRTITDPKNASRPCRLERVLSARDSIGQQDSYFSPLKKPSFGRDYLFCGKRNMNCPMCEQLKRELMEASVDFANVESEVRAGAPLNAFMEFDAAPTTINVAREQRDRAHTAYAKHLATHDQKSQAAETST